MGIFLIFIIVTLIASTLAYNANDVPVLETSLRVKQHRAGERGELVEGEQDHLKVIVKWNPVASATAYEVCQNCNISTTSGERIGAAGTVHPVKIDHTCGGLLCFIKPQCPRGINTFVVRAARALPGDERWTRWSDQMKFNVHTPGYAEHGEHDEL